MMQNVAPVQFDVEDGLMMITLTDPPLNPIPTSSLAILEQACERAEADSSVRVAIVSGEGSNFSAGAELNEMSLAITAEEAQAKSAHGIRVFARLQALQVPVIAAIRGLCVGGGLELAMSCHIRICSDRARLGLPEVNLGLMPGWGGTQRLPRLLSMGRALKMMLSGEMISAQQALQCGLVDEVVPDAELMTHAVGLAKRIASKSKVAVRMILRTVREGMEQPLSEALRLESRAFGKVCRSRDAREGVTAFVEKRQPKFLDE
jgi:enoyl-CoA hydratase/carnithine racemase